MRLLLPLFSVIVSVASARAQNGRAVEVDPPFPPELETVDRTFRGQSIAGPNVDWVYLIVYRPQLYVNYRSPNALYRSLTLGNLENIKSVKSGDATIGHFEYAWSCRRRRLPNGSELPARAGATGQTGDQDNGSVQMVLNGGGMTPLFVDYMDGYLEGFYEPRDMVNNRILGNVDSIQMIALAVSPEDCRRVATFTQTYKAAGADRRFGLLADPRKYEGGVCWSVAEAAVDHIPAARSMFDSYRVQFGVPWYLMGRPTTPPPRHAMLPPQLRGEGFQPVHIDKFNEPFVQWNDPSARNYSFQTFDFQAFGNEFENMFRGCGRAWCQEMARARSPIYRMTTSSGHTINTMMIDAVRR